MSISRKVALGLVQTAVSGDLDANLRGTIGRIREAAAKGAQIVCLQELFRTLYFPVEERAKAAHLAETIPGETTDALEVVAKELGVVIVAPLYEKAADGKLYNSAVVIDADGGRLDTYRKMHIPHDPHFWEQNYFAHGDRGYRVHKTRFAAISVLICFDQWFPEAARICALKGAEILFYPTAIGYMEGGKPEEGDWREGWTTIQRAHAVANSVHVAAVNRVGREGPLRFWGSSFVADAFGNLRARAGEGEEVLVCEIDLGMNARVREDWGFMRNRRPDSYAALSDAGR